MKCMQTAISLRWQNLSQLHGRGMQQQACMQVLYNSEVRTDKSYHMSV